MYVDLDVEAVAAWSTMQLVDGVGCLQVDKAILITRSAVANSVDWTDFARIVKEVCVVRVIDPSLVRSSC
jgi:DNA-binding transcriptional regulator YdaS (Cro superfamily)